MLRKAIYNIFILIGIYVTICTCWQWLELLCYGNITVRKVDTIIATILAYSLFCNYKHYILFKEIQGKMEIVIASMEESIKELL